ncbi:hypothetical protein GCM10011608_10210 [Micromonospora sonchi]|uniref:Uncharacterized protein n=1 Tax=Micromonospora sonchi TaxID=1763543 RepID=A0A917TL94_9ACTN|nr:hypothetical protein [Micromonospora sonchi]GGM27414.1 hypothetical protein GCM10011608_10210 [Micromonospora sonchi]
MVIDPISIGVTILAIYGMLQRNPDWSGGLLQEWQAARRGEESDAAKALRKKLTDAGVEPAVEGGPMRRHLSNMWRDYWTDRDRKRQSDRAERLADEAEQDALSWRERLNRRVDDEAARKVQGWKVAAPADPPASDSDGAGQPQTPENPAGGDTADPKPTDPAPQAAEAGGGDNTGSDNDGERWESTTVHDDDTYTTRPGPHPGPPPASPAEDRGPIRVDATVGDPIRSETSTTPAAPVAAITAGGTMTAVATTQTAVTGVVSGAAEARAIQAAVDQATQEYVATLNRLRGRIASLGEQTMGVVQMSGRSHVVANTAASAEAMAAAVANARACTAEVTPLLGNVARAFDRVNS